MYYTEIIHITVNEEEQQFSIIDTFLLKDGPLLIKLIFLICIPLKCNQSNTGSTSFSCSFFFIPPIESTEGKCSMSINRKHHFMEPLCHKTNIGNIQNCYLPNSELLSTKLQQLYILLIAFFH